MKIIIHLEEFRPDIEATVSETIAQIRKDDQMLGERLAFTEPEAARLLSMKAHQLRDERLRGRIGASGICKNGIRYKREDLLTYLARN